MPYVPKTSDDQMGHKLLAHSSVRSFGSFTNARLSKPLIGLKLSEDS